MLYAEITRAKGFEGGYYKTDEGRAQKDGLIIALLQQNISLMQDLKENGVIAILPRTMSNAKDFSEDIEEYKRFRNKNRR